MNDPRDSQVAAGLDTTHTPSRLAWGLALMVLTAAGFLAGCKSMTPATLSEEEKQPYIASRAQPGDVLRINFPGAPNLNSSQPVQPDGAISLPLGGSLAVRDKSQAEIEKAVLEVYAPQLVVKEVTVSLESAGFQVFVSGAVARPSRVQCGRSMTALEAIVEAGGFIEGRADLRHIKVVRLGKDNTTRTIPLDLKSTLAGEPGEPFYLRPSDVIHVPERFSFY